MYRCVLYRKWPHIFLLQYYASVCTKMFYKVLFLHKRYSFVSHCYCRCFITHISSPYISAVSNIQTSLFHLLVKGFVKLSTNKWKYPENYTFIDMYRYTGTDLFCFTVCIKSL